jgi:hypothetical protein
MDNFNEQIMDLLNDFLAARLARLVQCFLGMWTNMEISSAS